MKKIKSIIVVLMAVGFMIISAEAVNGQTRTRDQKQDGSCQDEVILKANDDAPQNQDQTRIRAQKKNRINFWEQFCDQLRQQKQDQLRDQKRDGSCKDEEILKANEDPAQDQTRTRDQKKTCLQICDPNRVQLRDQKQDQLRDQKRDGSCQDEEILKANEDPAQDQTRTREQKKTCLQICDPNCVQLRDQKQDQLRDQKRDGSCQDEEILKANEDPAQDQTRTRAQKKAGICDQTCEQKQDQLREQKRERACQD